MKPTEKHLDELLLAIQKVMNGDSSPSCKIVNNHSYRNKLSQKNLPTLKAKVYDEEERSWFRQGLPLEGYRSQIETLLPRRHAKNETNGGAKSAGRITQREVAAFKRLISLLGQDGPLDGSSIISSLFVRDAICGRTGIPISSMRGLWDSGLMKRGIKHSVNSR